MSGRWPSNFLVIHSPDCVRVGVKKVKGHNPGNKEPTNSRNLYGEYAPETPHIGYADPDGLEAVDDWICTKNCPVRRLGEQSGRSKSKLVIRRNKGVSGKGWKSVGYPDTKEDFGYTDEGTAARFYFQADWSYEQIEDEELWNGGMDDSL